MIKTLEEFRYQATDYLKKLLTYKGDPDVVFVYGYSTSTKKLFNVNSILLGDNLSIPACNHVSIDTYFLNEAFVHMYWRNQNDRYDRALEFVQRYKVFRGQPLEFVRLINGKRA